MSRVDDQRKSRMRTRAIELLRSNGVSYASKDRQEDKVVAAIEKLTGRTCYGDGQAFIEAFVREEAAKQAPPEKLRSTRQLTFSRTMQDNFQRSEERGVRFISMVSTVRHFHDVQ